MKIISNKKKLLRMTQNEKNVGFVPTMGGIHLGHVSLIKKSIKHCSKTVVSIFVNKPQFNNLKDFKKYPRNIKHDIKKLKKLKVDILYLPTHKQIYADKPKKKFKIINFKKKLCGKYRPGHFEAVVDVIDRFIKIFKPKKLYLGEKDFQQYKILESFINRDHPKTKVVLCKTIREKNKLPLSSRNFLLKPNEKKVASKIIRFLFSKKHLIIKKKYSIQNLKKIILKLGAMKIDYIEVININKIIKPFKKNKFKIFVAFYIKNIRIIDNI